MVREKLNYDERCFLSYLERFQGCAVRPRTIDQCTRQFRGKTKRLAINLAVDERVRILNKYGEVVEPKQLLLGSPWPYGGTIQVVR